MTFDLPADILEAAMCGYQEGVRVYWTKRQEGTVAAISTQEDYGVDAAVRAAFIAAAQLYPAPSQKAPTPGHAERFMRAAYALAGPRPPENPADYNEEPVWSVDLFEVERAAAHQDQPDVALEQLVPQAQR